MRTKQVGEEIRALTGLRGIAAIYVMIFHFVPLVSFSGLEMTFIGHGYLAVDLFFVLSGFVMALNYGRMFEARWTARTYMTFLGRRIARVYPLYLVATVCGCGLVSMGYLEGFDTTPVVKTFVFNVLMVQSWGFAGSFDAPAWSISAEFAAYLLFPIILVPCLFRRALWAWAVAAGCVAVIAVLCALPPSWGDKLTQDTLMDIHASRLAMPVVRCLPEFALGVLAYRLSTTRFGLALVRRRWIATVICLAIVLLLPVPRTDFVVVLLFPALVICLTSDRSLPGRMLSAPAPELIGKLSYSIYLTHNLIAGFLNRVHAFADELGLRHGQSYAVAAAILVTCMFSYLAYSFIEVPGRRWLRRVFERRQPSSAAVGPITS